MTRQEELRALVAEATAGPWKADICDPDDVVVWGPQSDFLCNIGHAVQQVGVAFDCDAANARLIAQAPTLAADLADALDEIERLRAGQRQADGPAEKIEAATDAIGYLLDWCLRNEPSRYHFGRGTRAFHRLARAYALLTGQSPEDVEAHYG